MAAASSVCGEASEKECSVCNELFSEPKLLPCGHLLCRHCVLSWLCKQKDASCPLCRCPIVDNHKWGSGEVDFEEFADSLPTDLAMKALVDMERILNKQHQCVCEEVRATALCLHCGDLLCPACTKSHKKMSVSKHHVVEDLSALNPDKLSDKRWEEPCAVHADKTSEVFCPKHGTFFCMACATADHCDCRNVTSLETIVAEAQKILEVLAAALSQGEAQLERGLSDLEQHMATVKEKTQAAIAEIEDTCNRLESAVKACRYRLKKLALSACVDVRKAVNGGKGVLQCRKGKLTTHKRAVERAQGMTSRSVVTRMTQALLARVKELDDTVTLPTEVKDMKEVTLTIDPKVVAHIEQLLQVNLDTQKCAEFFQKYPPFKFHHNCGHDVILSNNQLTAEKQKPDDSEGGLVLVQEPMVVHRLYEVQVDKLWEEYSKSTILPVGVLTSSPDTVSIPTSGRAYTPLWSDAIVLLANRVDITGTQVPSTLAETLNNMPVGSRVGLSLNDQRDLLLYRDGQVMGTITTAVPDPVYPLFHVNQRYRQITALPVTTLKRATHYSYNQGH